MNNLNLKLYFKKRKQRLSLSGLSLTVDWLFILGLSLMIFIVGIVYAVYLYININNDSFFKIEQDNSVQIDLESKKAEIQKVVEMLEKKE